MKHLFIATVLTVIGFSSFAQSANKIRVGIDMGYASTAGGGGLLFAVEPKYNLTNKINVGLRIGSAIMARTATSPAISGAGGPMNGSISGNSFYAATVEHYFNRGKNSFAPYVGAGLGLHTVSGMSFSSSSLNIGDTPGENKFGGLVRAGFESGKIRLGAEYNIVPASNYGTVSVNNNYLGIHFGFFVGGGKWGKAAK